METTESIRIRNLFNHPCQTIVAMNKTTFEIAASVGSALIFIILCMISSGGISYVISLLIFVAIISAAGMKLADFAED